MLGFGLLSARSRQTVAEVAEIVDWAVEGGLKPFRAEALTLYAAEAGRIRDRLQLTAWRAVKKLSAGKS